MPNLLDLMTSEERELMQKTYQKRRSGYNDFRKSLKIPPEIYIVAELGYYYGWGAIETVKRGYVESFDVDHKDGKRVEKRTKIPFTMEEANVLVEAARKVWYGQVIDHARGTQAASASILSKHPADTFKKSMKPYADRVGL